MADLSDVTLELYKQEASDAEILQQKQEASRLESHILESEEPAQISSFDAARSSINYKPPGF